jgi:hypothetical protein
MSARDHGTGNIRGVTRVVVFGVALCLVLLLAGIAWYCWASARESVLPRASFTSSGQSGNEVSMLPGPEQFMPRFERTQEEMTEYQVRVIFSGFISSRSESRVDVGRGIRLKRPSTFQLTYERVPSAGEGSLFAEIYFDADARVVGKEIGGWCD